MVNCDKIEYLRCATVLSVINDAVLSVKFEDLTYNKFMNDGAKFNDFDYDDCMVAFVDKPTMLGPANTSTYGSLNVGSKNKVLRRCAVAIGKNNEAEADFAVALGRRAHAQHYGSFVWAPTSDTYSVGTSTFTIGLGDANTLADAHRTTFTGDIYVATKNSKHDA